jgi:lipopolysaccharide transport system permease protein
MLYYGLVFSVNILMLPILTLLTTLLAIGVGMLISALNVKYRDIKHALPLLIQIWMYSLRLSILPVSSRIIGVGYLSLIR